MSGMSDKKQQPRVSNFLTQHTAIMEMSSSEQESEYNRSRATSFNQEPITARAFMHSPDATHQSLKASLDDFQYSTANRQPLVADLRTRLYSGADVDIAEEPE
jgi:hypothetical protein